MFFDASAESSKSWVICRILLIDNFLGLGQAKSLGMLLAETVSQQPSDSLNAVLDLTHGTYESPYSQHVIFEYQ